MGSVISIILPVVAILAIAFIEVKNRSCHLPNSFINNCTDSKGVPKTDSDGNTLYPYCNDFFGDYSCEPVSKVCNLSCDKYTQEPRCDFVSRTGYCCGVDGINCSTDKDCCNGTCQSNVCTGTGPKYTCAKDGEKCDSTPVGCCHTCLPDSNICGTPADKPVWKRIDNNSCANDFAQMTPTPIPPFKISDTTFVPEEVKTIEDFGDYLKQYCKKENGCSGFYVSEDPPGQKGVLPDWKFGVSWQCDMEGGSPELNPTKSGKNYVYIRQD